MARNPEAPTSKVYREIAARIAAAVARVNFDSDTSDRPKEILEEDGKLKIVWADGSETSFPFDFLRNRCPCALCVDEWSGKRKHLILLLPSNFRPLTVEPVGNYAIQIGWSDNHNSGIYSFRGLKELAAELNAAHS